MMAAEEKMDAIALLKADHRKVEELFEEFESARGDGRKEKLARQICLELTVHTEIEEKIFYPAFREAARASEDSKLYFEAVEEHHVVDLVLPEIKRTAVDADEFAAKAKVLKDLVEHHAEEEETEMFPRARTLLGREELMRLGRELVEAKESMSAGLLGKLKRLAS